MYGTRAVPAQGSHPAPLLGPGTARIPFFTWSWALGPGLHPDALQAEEGAGARPCLLLVTEKGC